MRISGCKMIQELGKTQAADFDSVKPLSVWGFPKLNLLRQQDNMASTLRAKEKIRTLLSQKRVGCFCSQLNSQCKCKYCSTALSLLVLETMLAETPQGSGPHRFLWAASSCSPCSQSYLYPRSHFAAQPHTSSHSLQYHVRPQLCQFSPQMVKLELFSSSFIAFSCSQFHHCPTTLESMILSLTHISQCCPFPSPLPATEYPHFSLLKTGWAMQSLKHQSPDSPNAPSATGYPDLWSIHQLSFVI